jgi:hypothetical protein
MELRHCPTPFKGDPSVHYRKVKGFLTYRVGDDGSVWSFWRGCGPWKKLRTTLQTKSGHLSVALYLNGKRTDVSVHALVLTAFRGPCPEGMEGCHFPDRNPANNALTNLRWDTSKGNQADRIKHGTTNRGERCGMSKLTSNQVLDIRRRVAEGQTYKKVAGIYKIARNTVSNIVTRKRWGHL